MSYPSADHRSIASEWQTTSLVVPKKAAKATARCLRRPYGDTLRQTPSPRLPHFVPEGLTAVKKILIFSSRAGAFLIPTSRIVGSSLVNGWQILTWPRPGQPQPAAPAGASRPPRAHQTPE